MSIPPISTNSSKSIGQPNNIGIGESIASALEALSGILNTLFSSRPNSLEGHVNQMTLSHDKPWEESGLFEYVPRELISSVKKELETFKVYALPTQSKEEIAECIKQMKISWKAPDQTPPDQMIFGTVCVKKFAQWVDTNKIAVKNLLLNDEDLKKMLPYLEYLDLGFTGFNQFELLATCTNLKHLDISHCQGLTDAHFQHIGQFTKLRSLRLDGCRELTDAALESIATTLPQLTSLNVTSCTKFTNAGFKYIATLTQLTSLNISGCNQLTDIALKDIATLLQLTSLDISGCYEFTDTASIAKLKELTSLDVSICLGLKDLALIAELKKLTSLNIGSCKLTDTTFEHITVTLLQLTSLKLSGCTTLTDESFKRIGKLNQLTFLNISYCDQLTDTALKYIATLPQLTFLNVTQCTKFTDTGLKCIADGVELKTYETMMDLNKVD